MKKIIALVLTIVMCSFVLTACGSSSDTEETSSDSDWAYIEENGKMVIGVTEYEPMNYYDENGDWTGFDTEFAQAVCEKLGVEPVFQVIDWDMKETELKAMNIDCIWNGLTVTEDRKENMDFSTSYLTNKQCVVINSSDADKFATAEDLSSAIISAEGGSAGETAIAADENLSKASYTAADSQAGALLGLLSGNYDAVVIDYTLASASVGQGDYKDMVILDGVDLEDEEYAIGFRVGSDMTEKVNAIIQELIDDGTLAEIAEKYDVTDLYEAAIN